MTRQHPEIKRDLIVLQITGQLFFLGLSILSVFYWKERQAFDAAHYLFEIIDRKFFFVAHQRPLGIVSQVLPLAGIWLHLPLKAIALLYSFGDILWYYLLFLWLGYGIKTRKGILSLLLLLSLTVRYSFFCPVTELLQGLALLIVWMSLLNRSFRFRIPVLLLLLFLVIFSHPLLFYPAIFAFLWWQINATGTGPLARILWPSFAVFILLKFLLLDAYDHDKTFYPLVYNDYGYVKTMSLATLYELFKVIVSGYPVVCLLLAGVVTLHLINGKIKQVLLLVFALAGYFLVIGATHRFGAITNYSERMLFPLPAMVAIAASGIPGNARAYLYKLISFTVLVLVLLLHFDVLRITARPYTLRTEQIKSVITAARHLGIQKGIVKEELMEQTSFAMTGWSYSMESLWISALDGPDSCVTIAMQRDHIDRLKAQGHTLRDQEWVKWAEEKQEVGHLNPTYFRLPESPYFSLYSGNQLYSGTIHLSLQYAEKINQQTAVLTFNITVPEEKILYSSEQTRLQLLLPAGPELRLFLPYHIKGGTVIYMEIPVGHLPAESRLEASLVSGSARSNTLFIRYHSGRFSEEK